MSMHNKKPLAHIIRAVLYGALPLIFLPSQGALAREVTFDTGILQSRGLSADLNRYFSKTPRYLPGVHSVQVVVNGKGRGTAAVRFGEDGTLCIDKDFLDFAGLMPVPLKSDEQCHNITTDYAQSVVNALPGQNSVELFLPPEALNSLNGDIKNFQHGGSAGMLNYSLFSTRSEYQGSESNTYSQASLEGGFNVADWALRSRYILTDDDGDKNAESLYTYAEHVFAAQRMTLQVGEINATSDVLSGVPITGMQLTPTSALQSSGTGVSVSGIARGSQARVEVRQNGRLIFNTLVPAGPFTLEDVPVVRSNVDLEVTVIESDGASSRFIVPASAVRAQGLARPQGLSASVGRVRNIDGDYDDPWVANVSDGWRVLPRLNLLASGMLAQDYQASGAQADVLLTDTWSASASVAGSREQFGEADSGLKTELQSSLSLSEQVSVSGSAAHYSGGYRELADALDDDFQPYDNTWSTNLSWSSGPAGTFNFGFTYNQAGGDGEDSRYILASWGKTFKYASVSVNWQSAVGNSDDDQDDDMLYVNLSIPLGGSQSISSYMRNQGDRTSYGVQNSGSLSEHTSYSLSADRDNESNDNSINGSISSNLHYTQLGLGGGSNGNHQRNYNASLSGGVAVHKSGVTFTPYSIRDTFAIATLNEPRAGVEISTPQGTVWTDKWGQAVIPGLNEWRNSRIEIDANKLPQSMTLANGTKYIAAAHASVSEVSFKILNSRRVMLRVKRPDGSALGKGLSIVDGKGNYVVTSVDDGHVFLNDADQIDALYAMDNNNNRICQIAYVLSDKRDEEAFYEEVNGECR
ncbi:fimbrial biogenesis usher protein [Citrobacter freundii]|uniref:Fimbrial biogenesis usher protein n=2 Tax=Citrobacter freundii TaxID=546 RepID=A0AAE7GVS6_CITFR|nr:fimbrial biogenesis usher protein [Citrobacter freundii]QLO15376.1 fimbrial biogenesis usher protein [Citrobacter freundii]